jgi:hypothetical protein
MHRLPHNVVAHDYTSHALDLLSCFVQIIDDHYNRIKGVATADNAKWGGGDITRGYTQLTTEYIPIRSKQLLQTYAPGGVRPLLPGPQDVSAVRLALGRSDTSSAAQQFVEVSMLVWQGLDWV